MSFADTDIPRSKYMYDSAGIERINFLLYCFFDLSSDLRFHQSAIAAFINYCELVCATDISSLQSVLLYSGPNTSTYTNTNSPLMTGVPFLVKVWRISKPLTSLWQSPGSGG